MAGVQARVLAADERLTRLHAEFDAHVCSSRLTAVPQLVGDDAQFRTFLDVQ